MRTPRQSGLGRVRCLIDANAKYTEYLKRALPCAELDGLRIVVDYANGAAYRCAPTLLREMGADVYAIGVDPSGHNINRNFGALASAAMIRAMREHDAHLGIAFDGDAVRVGIADETGSLVTSDQILGLYAQTWSESGRLAGGGIVGTVNSNSGLEHYVRARGLGFIRSNAGDHHLVRTMQAHGMNLGGEHSGHFVFRDALATSDGFLAALQVASLLAHSRSPASTLLRVFMPLPQLFIDAPLREAHYGSYDEAIEALRKLQRQLNRSGRVVVRRSRTEPVIRVVVEAESQATVCDLAKEVTAKLLDVSNVQINAAE